MSRYESTKLTIFVIPQSSLSVNFNTAYCGMAKGYFNIIVGWLER